MPSIEGTWKLLHATVRDSAGTARPAPYGGKALGRVTFTADGRMMSVVCDGRKELPSGVSREYSSYCGNYTYDGEKLVTRVDAASDPSRIGSDQVRGVRFEGDRMVLIPPPRRTGEIEEHREITWGTYRGGVKLRIRYIIAKSAILSGGGSSKGVGGSAALRRSDRLLRHVTGDVVNHALFAAAQLDHIAISRPPEQARRNLERRR